MKRPGGRKAGRSAWRHATGTWAVDVRVGSSGHRSTSEARVVGEDVREIAIGDGEGLDEDRGALERVGVPKGYDALERVIDQMFQSDRQLTELEDVDQFTTLSLLSRVDEGRIRDDTFEGFCARVRDILAALDQVRETDADISRVRDEVAGGIDEAEARTVDVKGEETKARVNRAL